MTDGQHRSFFRTLLRALLGRARSVPPDDQKQSAPDSEAQKYQAYYRKQKGCADEQRKLDAEAAARCALVKQVKCDFQAFWKQKAPQKQKWTKWEEWQAYLNRAIGEIESTGQNVSFQAGPELYLRERAAKAQEFEKRDAQRREQERQREEQRAAEQQEQHRIQEEKRRREEEAEKTERLRREILAEGALRQGLLEKERAKAAMRTKMETSGEVVADNIVRAEREELARLRENRQPRKPQA